VNFGDLAGVLVDSAWSSDRGALYALAVQC